MAFMAGAGAGMALMVTASTIVKDRFHLPYYYLMGTANIAVGAGLAIASAVTGDLQRLAARGWKWVILRGAFGMACYALALLAVAYGSPLGDASALQSINVVMSALLGRAFLGESLRALHIATLCMSVVGAWLVSKPESLFGGHASGAPWLGYGFALSSGFVSGALFIASRKSQGISPLVMTSSVTLQEGAIHFVLAWCGTVKEMPMTRMLETPVQSIAMFMVFLFLVMLASGSMSVGSQMCPAAMSSTIFTCTSMSLSFAAQTLLHSEPPELLTVMGAALMLSAVSLMAFARWYYSPGTARSAPRATGKDGVEEGQPDFASNETASQVSARAGEEGDDDETQSLASFVASELSGVSKESLTTTRQRRNPANLVAPQQLGYAGA